MTTIEWPSPWKPVDDRRQAYIAGELAWELSHFPHHLLAGRIFQVLAMMDAYDNAILQFDDGMFGYVHLSWRAQPPHFEPVRDVAELNHFLRRPLSDQDAAQDPER